MAGQTEIPEDMGPAVRLVIWGALPFIFLLVSVEKFSDCKIQGGLALLALSIISTAVAVYWNRLLPSWVPFQYISSLKYLHNEEAGLTTAVRDMATYSAWAKWYAAQSLAMNNHQLISQESLMRIAASEFRRALLDGKLNARGRPSNAIEYEPIPRDAWWLVYIEMVRDPATLWRAEIRPPVNVEPQRVSRLLNYDSIVVSAHDVEDLWPKTSWRYDRARKQLLKQAEKAGANPEHIKFLRKGDIATPGG